MMRTLKILRDLALIVVASCIVFPQVCRAQEDDAAFASYSAEVLSSSRRTKELRFASPEVPSTNPTQVTSQVPVQAATDAVGLETRLAARSMAKSKPSLLPQRIQPTENASNTANTPAPQLAPVEFADALDTGNLLRKLIAGVVLSVSLCFAILFVGSHWSPQRQLGGSVGSMQLVDTLHVGQRCCLHLVQIRDQLVIVGRDGSGIREVVPLTSSFADRLDQEEKQVDQEVAEFERAAEALLAQKGVTGWKRTKLRER